jgi:hypothetical protein
MISTAFSPTKRTRDLRGSDEILIDYRRRRELDEQERAERKRMLFAEQSSSPNSPGARIRAWERVHELRMPSSPVHPVLALITAATQLTLADVHEEQRVRAARIAGTEI